jgi:hypothetical protein
MHRTSNREQPCSVAVGYRRFGSPCCLHLHRDILVSRHNYYTASLWRGGSMDRWNVSILLQQYTASPWRWKHHGHPKRWYPTATLYGITLKVVASWTSETSVSYHNTTRHHTEGGSIMDLRNVGILPQHYTVSQPRIFTAVKPSNLAAAVWYCDYSRVILNSFPRNLLQLPREMAPSDR